MKQAVKCLIGAAVAVSINVLVSSSFAESGHWGSVGSHVNFHDARYYGGGYHGGGYYGGYHGGWYYGGHYGSGWGWYPWSFSFVYAPSPYYYGGYYYSPPTAYYAP